ncbi:uncharacterized protein [Amphiura filiformis]|uniref:uncharacterized protein isoform X2 n=1 Tax=Amphiura filiformis TaxID=82378 RepID=UPI003B21E565
MERYKYFLFGYLWIFLVILQQDIWPTTAEETTLTPVMESKTTLRPFQVDGSKNHVYSTQKSQIPAHRAKTIATYDITMKITAPPIITRRRPIITRKVLKTTKKPITAKQAITTPKIPQTTKLVPVVTRAHATSTPVPVTSAHGDSVGSDGVRVLYHCSFELNENCRFRQDTRDELDWVVERDPSPSSTSNGRFAHLTPRKSIGKPGPIGGRARIATPYIEAPEGYVDLSFLYHIFNSNPELVEGILNVFACQKQLVWSSSASWGNHWFKADIKITCNEGFRIIFEGFIGGVNIDIAIDDVSVTGPQKPKTVPTTKLLTTEDFTTDGYELSTTPFSGPSIEPPMVTPHSNDTDPGTDTKIAPVTAVSLVAVSVGLFVTTVVMLIVSLVIHARVCSKRSKYPAHIIYHGPEFFNRGTDGDPTGYMTLNFRDGISSRSGTGTGTEVLTLSDRQSDPTPIDRSSWEQVIMRDMIPVRRESKTFPIMKEIKHLLEAVHMRRIRTLSAHLSTAEVETLRRQFTPDNTQDTTQDSGTQEHDRTRSTVALDRTASSIRPLSEISEHFYYSLFPDPNKRPDLVRPDSGLSGLGQFNNGFDSADGGSRPTTGPHRKLGRSVSRPLSSPNMSAPRTSSESRPRKDSPKGSDSSSPEVARGIRGKEHIYGKARPRPKSPVDDIEIIDETKEEEEHEVTGNGDHGEGGETGSLAPEQTEMVENEIYEPYSGDVESDAQSN